MARRIVATLVVAFLLPLMARADEDPAEGNLYYAARTLCHAYLPDPDASGMTGPGGEYMMAADGFDECAAHFSGQKRGLAEYGAASAYESWAVVEAIHNWNAKGAYAEALARISSAERDLVSADDKQTAKSVERRIQREAPHLNGTL